MLYLKYCLILFILSSLQAFAQQNYFNVPSFDPTLKGKPFFQEQLNFSNSIESNTTYDYGLGNESEIGFNIYGAKSKNYFTKSILEDDKADRYKQMFLVNFLKVHHFDHENSIAIGAQLGTRMQKTIFKNANMFYLGYSYQSDNRLRLSIGPWFANSVYTKDHDHLGFQGGIEYCLPYEQIHLVADYLSGVTPMSVSVLGIVLMSVEDWPISLGWQKPNNTDAGQAFVFELTHKIDHM